MAHRMSWPLAPAALWLGLAGAARAGLPADGWPQARRDAALTGRADEPALLDPVIAWTSRVGDALGGEPAASGCSLFVGNGGGRVLRVNARSGDREWVALGPLETCRPAIAQPSSLALDDSGELHAGVAGDDGLLALYQALCRILQGIESYAIDNNDYPPGPDLAAQLVPTYLAWPDNPCTGAPMLVTDASSDGDARYERPAPGLF